MLIELLRHEVTRDERRVGRPPRDGHRPVPVWTPARTAGRR
ncbi:hypothetical protein [Micromonospora deserti]|nr:hypothetical protein [Micromonospora deserti]